MTRPPPDPLDRSDSTTVPSRCNAAVFVEADQPLELREFEVPPLGPEEALVRVTCSTICGSDVHTMTGARDVATPSVLGHEIVGVVAAVGEPAPTGLDGDPLRPGCRVTWAICVACGECDRCQRGLTQKCRHTVKYGHALADEGSDLTGGWAEYVRLLPGTSVLEVPPALADEVVCPANCATATVAAAFEKSGCVTGRRVLVSGAGMLGLTAAAFAKWKRAERVVVCDTLGDRLERARAFGANATVLWHEDPEEFDSRLADASGNESGEFDVIIEASGAPSAIEASLRHVAVGGHVVLVGSVFPSRHVQLDPEQLVRRLASIVGIHNYTDDDLRTALQFLAACHDEFPFADLVESAYPLARVNEAARVAISDRPVRVAIRP